MGVLIDDPAARHREFTDRLAERQSVMISAAMGQVLAGRRG
jgi:hypothetical protein